MSVREFVKILLAKECMTLTQLAKLATENSEKNILWMDSHIKCEKVH